MESEERRRRRKRTQVETCRKRGGDASKGRGAEGEGGRRAGKAKVVEEERSHGGG